MTRARRLVFVAAGLVVWLLPGVPTHGQGDGDYFVSGVAKFQRGEYDQAAADLQKAVAEHPEWQEAWFYLGAAQFESTHGSLAAPRDLAARDYTAAEQALQKAKEMAPGRPGVRVYLGRIAEDREQYEQAAAWYREEMSLKGLVDKHAMNVALARVAYKMGHYNTAMDLLNAVLGQEPRYVEARYYLGLCQLALKQYDLAVETFKRAIKTLNDWLDRVYHLLRIEYEQLYPNDPARATKVVEDWDELRKELWTLRQAVSRPAKQTLEEIIQEYRRAQEFALDLHLWPEANKALGDAYLGKRDWAAARSAYRDAQEPRQGEGSTEDPDTWVRIGRAYFLQGKQTFEEKGLLLRAIEEFKAAEGDSDPDPANWDGYGRALHVVGINKATKLADLEAPPEPDPLVASIFDGLGELYLYQANTYASDEARQIKSHTHNEALEQLDKALFFYPNYLPAMLHKAQCLLARSRDPDRPAADREKDVEQARQLMENALLVAKKPTPDLLAEKAQAYLAIWELGRADREQALRTAEQAANEALALDRRHLTALNMVGLVQYYRGHYVEAVALFARATEAWPRDYQSYLNLGNALFGLHSWARAGAEYRRALDLIPKASVANTGSQRPYVMFLIARTLYEQKLYDQAIKMLAETLTLRTDLYQPRLLLAFCYKNQGKWDAAEEALRACLKLAPDERELANVHAYLGQLYEARGQVHEAVAEYRIAQSYYPQNVEAESGLRRLAVRPRQAQ